MRISSRPSSRTLIRILAVVPVLASFTVIGSASGVGPSVAGCAQAASVHHAALVVEHGDGTVITVCVAFPEGSITGDQLLARSQVEYATADSTAFGKAVCQIDHEPPDGQVPPGCWTASYWAISVSRGGGSWTMSSLGISSQTFRDGDAEGFRYEGQSDHSFPPSPRGVCPPVASPTPVPVVTAKPTQGNVSTHTAPPSSSRPSPTAAANTTSAASPTASEPAPSDPASSTTARATVATAGTTPTAQPPFLSAGAWAASGLGVVLLVLLVVQVVRPRRRPSPPPGLP
jgi:hypothetical protein